MSPVILNESVFVCGFSGAGLWHDTFLVLLFSLLLITLVSCDYFINVEHIVSL